MKNFFNFQIVIALILFCCSVNCSNYPSDVPKCKYDDTECLPKVINQILKLSKNGIPGLDLVAIDPLILDSFDILQSDDNPVGIKLNLKNYTMHGFSTAEYLTATGLNKDPKDIEFRIKMRLLTAEGKYNIHGKVLILPIHGNGYSNLTFTNLNIKMKFITNLEMRNNEQYLNVEKVLMNIKVKKMGMYFDNLFNDRTLSDPMNLFLNENQADIYRELKKAIETGFAEVVRKIVKPLFAKFPYKDLFIDEE